MDMEMSSLALWWGKADYISQVKLFGIKDMTGWSSVPLSRFDPPRHEDIGGADGSATAILQRRSWSSSRPRGGGHQLPRSRRKHPRANEVAKKQMSAPVPMISLRSGRVRASRRNSLNSLKLCTFGSQRVTQKPSSEHPASMTHSHIEVRELKAVGNL